MKRIVLFSTVFFLLLSGFAWAQLNIVIDGQRDDFYNSLTCPDNGHIVIGPEAFLAENGPQPDSPEDLSTKVWIAWDETYLYYYEERTDDELLVNNPTNWQNDCVELKFDADPITASGTEVDNARLTVFDTDDADDPNGVDNINGDGTLDFTPTPDDYARVFTDNGVNMEFRIPWTAIVTSGDGVNVGVGNVFGFAVNISDNDGTARDGTIQWSAGMADAVWNTPTLMGTVKFLEGNKLQFIPQNTRDPNVVNENADAWYTDTETCVATPFEIVIDGQRDSFFDGLACPEDGHIVIGPEAFLAENGPQPDSPEDLSTKVWIAWDETYLYYYEERTDDELLVNNPTNWQNDCVELKFDADPITASGTEVDNARLTVFDTDDADDPNGVDNINGDGTLDFTPTPDDYARVFTDNGVNMEFRIPWTAIVTSGDGVNVGVGNVFGFAVNISDNDGTARDGTIQWSAGMADAVWNTPTLMGTVKFLEGNKLQFIPQNTRDPNVVNENADAWYTDLETCIVGIEIDRTAPVADNYVLEQNYPNPFNPSTTIRYSLKTAEYVTLSIYNTAGQLVVRLIDNQSQPTGTYQVTWDGTDEFGNQLASGVYLYRLSTSSFSATKKMMLLK